MPRRHHRKPREPAEIVLARHERVERSIEPFTRLRKLRVEFTGDFGTHLVTTAANARAKRRNHILRARPKFHLHPAEGFCRDAAQRAAPACMNRGDRPVLRIRQQHGNAIGGLYAEQDAALAREKRVALQLLARPQRR